MFEKQNLLIPRWNNAKKCFKKILRKFEDISINDGVVNCTSQYFANTKMHSFILHIVHNFYFIMLKGILFKVLDMITNCFTFNVLPKQPQ